MTIAARVPAGCESASPMKVNSMAFAERQSDTHFFGVEQSAQQPHPSEDGLVNAEDGVVEGGDRRASVRHGGVLAWVASTERHDGFKQTMEMTRPTSCETSEQADCGPGRNGDLCCVYV